MWPAFDKLLTRFRELEQQLADPAVIGDHSCYTKAAKEHGSRAKTVRPYLEYLKLTEDVRQAETIAAAETDPAMRAYAEEELAALRQKLGELRSQLEDFLLVEPGEDFDSVILEIRAGTGGDEAALFAGDLYGMYTHYARDRGWKVEEIAFSPGEQGGVKAVVLSVNGPGGFRD